MEEMFNETRDAIVKMILRVVVGAETAEIINDGSAAVFTKGEETKYVTVQEFPYDDLKHFYCNKDTFSGEVGVLQIAPSFAYFLNRDKMKKRLEKYRGKLKKNKNGDWYIDVAFVKDLLHIVGVAGENVNKKEMEVAYDPERKG